MTNTDTSRLASVIARGLLWAVVVTPIAAIQLAAQQTSDSIKRSVISPVDFTATNTGTFGYDPTGRIHGLIYPRGSGHHYLYGSGFWFGAKKRTAAFRPLVFYTYNPSTGRSIASPGEFVDTLAARPDLYHSVDYDRNTGRYLGALPSGAPNWPLWSAFGAPWASILDPGSFEPDNRRRLNLTRTPAFAFNADEEMVARFNDGGLGRYELDSAQARQLGYPLGLQIQESIFAWSSDPLGVITVLQYQVVNASPDTLFDCVMAHVSDPDIGSPGNDRSGFLSSWPVGRTGFVYSGPEDDGNYGTLVITLLEAPMTDANGILDNSRRLDYPAVGRVGAFPRWVVGSDQEPVTYRDRYELMTSGGFASDDDTMPSADLRAMIACTPFIMHPGDTAFFAVGYAIVPTTHDSLSIDAQRYVNGLVNMYYARPPDISLTVDESTLDEPVRLTPNPAFDIVSVSWSDARAEPTRIRVVDVLGRTIIDHPRRMHPAGDRIERLDVSALRSGTYTVAIETDRGVRSRRLVVAK